MSHEILAELRIDHNFGFLVLKLDPDFSEVMLDSWAPLDRELDSDGSSHGPLFERERVRSLQRCLPSDDSRFALFKLFVPDLDSCSSSDFEDYFVEEKEEECLQDNILLLRPSSPLPSPSSPSRRGNRKRKSSSFSASNFSYSNNSTLHTSSSSSPSSSMTSSQSCITTSSTSETDEEDFELEENDQQVKEEIQGLEALPPSKRRRGRYVHVFVFWSPDAAKTRTKLAYSNSRRAIKKALFFSKGKGDQGSSCEDHLFEYHASDPSDLRQHLMIEKVLREIKNPLRES